MGRPRNSVGWIGTILFCHGECFVVLTYRYFVTGAIGPPPSTVDPIIPEIKAKEGQLSKRSLKSIFDEDGPEAFARAVRSNKGLLVTDTTWRDAHQSLLATRLRTKDILNIAEATKIGLSNAYSIENWGGATVSPSRV